MSKDDRSMAGVASFLRAPGAPGALTTPMVHRLVGGNDRATLHRRIERLIGAGVLRRVQRGVYLNLMSDEGLPAVLPLVVPGGYLSLATVLGECGVTNNPVPHLQVVVPWREGRSHGRINTRRLSDGVRIEVFTIPERLTGFGMDRTRRHNRATPERALVDWLYLGRNRRSRIGPVPDDVDLSLLNESALDALASKVGVSGELDALRERIAYAESGTAPEDEAMPW